MRRSRGTLTLACLCLALGLPAPAVAQTPTVPRLPQDTPREPQPAPRDAPVVIDRERFSEEAPPGAAALRLRLQEIQLSGNTALSTDALRPLWAPWLGQEITLEQVFQLARRIGAAYRDAGYVLSQALVPQQDIDQARGIVRIRVAEGYISRIVLAQPMPGSERLLAMLEPVRRERPLTLATLERHLLLLNDLPGVTAVASLRAAPEDNAAALELVVSHDRAAYGLQLHNRTAAATGSVRVEALLERRGLLAPFDRHALRWVTAGSDRLNVLAYAGEAPVGLRGLVASWSLSAAKSRPAAGVAFEPDTRSSNASLGLAYPLLRSRASNVALRATLALYNGSSDLGGGLVLSRDRLRTVRLGLTADHADAWGGLNLVELELAKGLDALGASRPGDATLGVAGSNPQFHKATLYAARLQSLGGEWSVLAAVSGQSTSSTLASAERFGLGGELFLRAYDPSELLGDTGLAGKIELRVNVPLSFALGTLYAYHDEGQVRRRAIDGSRSSQSAASSGIGLRLSAARGLKAYLELSKPHRLAPVQTGDLGLRVFAGAGIDL